MVLKLSMEQLLLLLLSRGATISPHTVCTVDFNRKRLKCGWNYFSRVSTASTAFQPSQEISDDCVDQGLVDGAPG